MTATTLWSQQHRTITAAIAELAAEMAMGAEADLVAVQLRLARLTALLRLHFRQENDFLYPDLLHSDDPTVAETGRAFHAEVGELWQQYEYFVRRWPSHLAIAADFEAFRAEARAMFEAIDDRCRREDVKLFPTVRRNCSQLRRLAG